MKEMNEAEKKVYVDTIKSFITNRRPLIKEREDFLKANLSLFTDEERTTYLPWKGAVGGQTMWLQLGIGWYKNPTLGGVETPIPDGMFDPYRDANGNEWKTTDECLIAYAEYLRRGGLPQDEATAEKG
jgi:hypothetical protein